MLLCGDGEELLTTAGVHQTTNRRTLLLLSEARASSNLSPEARASFVENELGLLGQLDGAL